MCVWVAQLKNAQCWVLQSGPIISFTLDQTVNEKYVALQTMLMIPVLRVVF